MSKAVILVLGLIACSLAVAPFEEIKGIVERDECSISAMETLTPKIQEKIAVLKKVTFCLNAGF